MAKRYIEVNGVMKEIDTEAPQEQEVSVEVRQLKQPKEKGSIQKLMDTVTGALTPKKTPLQTEAERIYAEEKRKGMRVEARRMAEAKIEREQLSQLKKVKRGQSTIPIGTRMYTPEELQSGQLENMQEQGRILSEVESKSQPIL